MFCVFLLQSQVAPLTEEIHSNIMSSVVGKMASNALRTIALAYKLETPISAINFLKVFVLFFYCSFVCFVCLLFQGCL